MNRSETTLPQPVSEARKRIILTMGGKGGVGKTSFMVAWCCLSPAAF
jgi:Mrp family chromosome partitioning ATPase